MTVPHFMNAQELADVCRKMVADLNTRHIENLIIDIRDNGGGTSMAGDTLLSYIAKTPFMQYEKVWTKVTPITQRLARRNNEQGVNFYIIDKMTHRKPMLRNASVGKYGYLSIIILFQQQQVLLGLLRLSA